MGKPATVSEYLKSLPPDRARALRTLRKVIKGNLDKGIREIIQYGMIGYAVPHSLYPEGYHTNPDEPLPFIALASQKNHMGLYLFCVYTDAGTEKWFRDEWKKSGHKLDMGKSCVRFKSIDDVPVDLVGKLVRKMTVKKFIKSYEDSLPASVRKKRGLS